MYPIAKSDSTSDEREEEYMSFSSLRDPEGLANDKTNVMTTRIPKMRGALAHRAEEYCKLRSRFESEVWGRLPTGKCTLFSKVRDFASVTDPEVAERAAAERLFTSHIAAKAKRLAASGKDLKFKAAQVPSNTRIVDLELFMTTTGHANFKNALFGMDTQDINSPCGLDALMERLYWECLAREIFRSPHDAHTTQLEYLQHDVRKPYNEKFTHFKHRVEELFSYLKYFPAPCQRSAFPSTAQMDERDRAIPKNQIRRAVYNALPVSWHTAYEKRTSEDVLALSDEQFMTIFNTIEEEDLRERAVQEAQKKKSEPEKNKNGKRPKDSGSESNHGGETGSSNQNHNHKKKRSSKFCKKCKDAGRGQPAYTSHNESECTWKGSVQSSLTSNTNSEFKKMKKEFKAMRKMLASMGKDSSKSTSSKPTKYKGRYVDPYDTPSDSDSD
jgi:hypothetical protein